MAFLEKTSFTLEKTKEHLSRIGESEVGDEPLGESDLIENYLVQYALVSFYSEMEQELAKIVRNRLALSGDQKLATFLYNLNEKMIKRAKTSDMRSFLKNFGCTPEDLLSDVNESELSFYGTAIANRHQVSHASGGTMSLGDLERALDAAKKILTSVETTIR